jgi:hypothetical protein
MNPKHSKVADKMLDYLKHRLQMRVLLHHWLTLAYGARDQLGRRGPHPMDN